ncbi:MAG: hypothetical protein RUMPE_01163 [Eubacteriales bacterium SKADARSKE-1]|nr:hypothetical protein [Eubacteriales bacterium SKADARSKE-1]
MFVLAMKPLKRKIIIGTICLVGLIFLSLFLAKNCIHKNDSAASSNGEYNVCVKNNEGRVQFLSQFGWEVQTEPIEVSEITIPAKFNDTYEKYNNIQKEQGLDLSKHKNKTCIKYTYQILNYKNAPGGIRANLLVLNNRVIGGDICSVELNGFMHGFVLPENNNFSEMTYNTYVTNNVNAKPKGNVHTPSQTTYRETLDPDPNMPTAPTD